MGEMGPAYGVRALKPESAEAFADEIEARLAGRLGQQILQLSEVVRRVVHAQATITQQWSTPGASAAPVPVLSSLPEATSGSAPVSDRRRRAAIDDLYKELRQLERNDTLRTSTYKRG